MISLYEGDLLMGASATSTVCCSPRKPSTLPAALRRDQFCPWQSGQITGAAGPARQGNLSRAMEKKQDRIAGIPERPFFGIVKEVVPEGLCWCCSPRRRSRRLACISITSISRPGITTKDTAIDAGKTGRRNRKPVRDHFGAVGLAPKSPAHFVLGLMIIPP